MKHLPVQKSHQKHQTEYVGCAGWCLIQWIMLAGFWTTWASTLEWYCLFAVQGGFTFEAFSKEETFTMWKVIVVKIEFLIHQVLFLFVVYINAFSQSDRALFCSHFTALFNWECFSFFFRWSFGVLLWELFTLGKFHNLVLLATGLRK